MGRDQQTASTSNREQGSPGIVGPHNQSLMQRRHAGVSEMAKTAQFWVSLALNCEDSGSLGNIDRLSAAKCDSLTDVDGRSMKQGTGDSERT